MCLLNAEQAVHTRQCKDISLAYLYATTPHMFSPEDNTEQAFNNVRDAVRTPLYGCDCYAYGLLASGHVDLVVEADLKPYDFMALVPIVEEAGGVMTDWLVSPHCYPCCPSLTVFTIPSTAFMALSFPTIMHSSQTSGCESDVSHPVHDPDVCCVTRRVMSSITSRPKSSACTWIAADDLL